MKLDDAKMQIFKNVSLFASFTDWVTNELSCVIYSIYTPIKCLALKNAVACGTMVTQILSSIECCGIVVQWLHKYLSDSGIQI